MNKWKIATDVPMEMIEMTEVNANHMEDESFNRLCENIKKTGGLSSMIATFKRKKDGKYVIISGNHRYKACLRLGWSKMNILYADEDEISNDEKIALQLSHNNLHGEDNKNILKRLFDEIQSIDFKQVSNVDINDFATIDVDAVSSIVPLSEHYPVSLILYDDDIRNIEELFGLIEEKENECEKIILANGKGVQDEFLDLMTKMRKEYSIKSTSVSFSKILELARLALENGIDKLDKNQGVENV